MAEKHNVLVVGGGFAGVKAALELCGDERFKVTLLDDDDELRYYPTLFHTATGGKRSNSSIPFNTIFEGKNLTIATGVAKTVDRKAKTVTTEDGASYSYDSLILALGVVTNYFGIPGLPEFSYSIKSQAEVAKFKKHLHQQLIDERKPDLNYVIVGAGPTGIELSGSLGSYLREIMKRHGLPERKIHIDLIEAAPRLLPRLPKHTSNKVRRQLRRLGIRLYFNSVVQGQSADELTVSGKPIRSHTVVWTAGVTNHPFFKENNFVLMGRGKVGVDTYLQTEPDIYVLGDNANTPYSGLAQTALYDGIFVASNLKRKLSGKDMKSYIARKPVTVIPAGPHWASVIWGRFRFNGFLGYLIREAGDFVGFQDLEPLDKAAKQWYSTFTFEDDCDLCATAKQ
jgi:NADH dehydrogenase